MKTPKVLVLTGFGINCDYETKWVFEKAGAEAKRVHINDIISRKEKLDDYQILALPGGFVFGDDLGSAKVLANKMKFTLEEQLMQFIEDGKLAIGICNGFQAMVKMGMLPGFGGNYNMQECTLTFNDSGRFEDRWVHVKTDKLSKCVFTQGMDRLYLPVRHGEGKFVPFDKEVLERLAHGGHIALRYCDAEGKPTQEYPFNPNGAVDAVAGICDETGRIFGLMPHPECHSLGIHHPRWTRREEAPERGEGIRVFENGVNYVKENF